MTTDFQRERTTQNEPLSRSSTISIWSPLRLLAVVLCLATIAGLGARSGWLFDLATGYRLQYLLLLSALCVLFMLGRKSGMMLLTAAFALANLWPIAGYYIPREHLSAAGSPVSVLFATAGSGSGDSLARLAERDHADIVAICGLDADGIRRMRARLPEHRYVVAQPREDPFGAAIFSRFQIIAGRVATIGRSRSPVAIARCRMPLGDITFVAARALPARGSATWAERNAQLADLGTLVAGEKGEVVLLGAFELTPWSPFFTDLRARGRLEDGRMGEGVKPTWPLWMGAAGLPLDHMLHTSGIVVERIETLRFRGSDHRALVATFRIAGK